jgi:hypothetical protein
MFVLTTSEDKNPDKIVRSRLLNTSGIFYSETELLCKHYKPDPIGKKPPYIPFSFSIFKLTTKKSQSMSILKLNVFHQTFKGRMTCILLALAIFNLNSCTVYKSTETDMDYVSSNKQILENLDIYKFYVHDQYGSYLLKNPSFNADGSMSGELNAVNYQKPDSTWNAKERKAYWQDHKYDIGIYLNQTVSDLRADLNATDLSSEVTIKPETIEKMTISSIDKEGELAVVAVALLIVLGIIVALALLIVLIAVAAEGSDGGNGGGSDSDSGGSGSGSS